MGLRDDGVMRPLSTSRWAIAIAIVVHVGLLRGAAVGSIRDRLDHYRRCIAIRSVVSPRLFARRDERVVGAVLDCARHRADAIKTITSATTPIPKVIASRRAKALLARVLTFSRTIMIKER
jgi:hypothetical protein